MEVSMKTVDYKHGVVRRQTWKHLLIIINDIGFYAGMCFFSCPYIILWHKSPGSYTTLMEVPQPRHLTPVPNC